MSKIVISHDQRVVVKSITKCILDVFVREGYPDPGRKGRWLHDKCSEALGFKNYNELYWAASQNQRMSDSALILRATLEISRGLKSVKPFSTWDYNPETIAVLSAIRLGKKFGIDYS